MAGYDPQKNRRRPTAADTGTAPVDGLLGGTEAPAAPTSPSVPSMDEPVVAAAPTVPSPTVTPPPPVPDPDPRLVTAAAGMAGVGALVTVVVLRRWWRRRH